MLTVGRLVAAPGVALCLALLPRPTADWAALGLFVAAAFTDFLDGKLARAWGQESALGRMLDPIADKAMALIALACVLALRGTDPLAMVPAAAIYLREIAVSGLREFLAGKVVIAVTTLAKWKTTAQLVALAALLAAPPLGSAAVEILGLALLWLAAALTLATGWQYFRNGVARLEEAS